VTTLFFFNRTLPAKITGASAEAEGLPAAVKENFTLQLNDYRFYVGIWLAMYQYRSVISIEDITHLLRCRRIRRTNQALSVSIASELTLQANPGGSYNF
jgi:hypothetical protein